MLKMIIQWISWLSLAALIGMAFLYLAGKADIAAVKKWMLVMTIIWFASAAFWMRDDKK
jgi:hypothetical protein